MRSGSSNHVPRALFLLLIPGLCLALVIYYQTHIFGSFPCTILAKTNRKIGMGQLSLILSRDCSAVNDSYLFCWVWPTSWSWISPGRDLQGTNAEALLPLWRFLTPKSHVGIRPGELGRSCLGCRSSLYGDGYWPGLKCPLRASLPHCFHWAFYDVRGVGRVGLMWGEGPGPPSEAGDTRPSYHVRQWHSSRGAWPRKPGRTAPSGSCGQSPAVYNPALHPHTV